MYIINENFEAGEVYTSLIDGTEFEVKEIKEKDKKKYVEFYCLKDKKMYEVDYKTAMRLLLEKKGGNVEYVEGEQEMKKCELKVVKFSEGAKVYEEVLGDVMVFEGRISSKVWEKWHKIAYEKIKVGRQEYLGFYIEDKKVNPPEPLSDFAYVEK